MFLSRSAEYALRIMAVVALKGADAGRGAVPLLRASDIAADANVPVAYMQKVLRRMVAAGLLVSEKGHGGGFRLSRPAKSISFAHVLAAIETKRRTTPCIFGLRACNAKTPCVLHHHYALLKDQFATWSKNTTLASINPKHGRTGVLLGLAPEKFKARKR